MIKKKTITRTVYSPSIHVEEGASAVINGIKTGYIYTLSQGDKVLWEVFAEYPVSPERDALICKGLREREETH